MATVLLGDERPPVLWQLRAEPSGYEETGRSDLLGVDAVTLTTELGWA